MSTTTESTSKELSLKEKADAAKAALEQAQAAAKAARDALAASTTSERKREGIEDFKATIAKPISKEFTRHDKMAELVRIRKIMSDGLNRAHAAAKATEKLIGELDLAMDGCVAPA